jgi:hypothetical protein
MADAAQRKAAAAALKWLELPVASLRVYLDERGVEPRELLGLSDSDLALFARAKAGSVGESICDVRLAGLCAARKAADSPAAERAAQAAERESEARSPRACAMCGAEGGPLSVCAACKGVSYCSRACQRAAWPAHKNKCFPVAISPPQADGADQADPRIEQLFAAVGSLVHEQAQEPAEVSPSEASRLGLLRVTAAVKRCALPPLTISQAQHAHYLAATQALVVRLGRSFPEEALELGEASLAGARALLVPGHPATRGCLLLATGMLDALGRYAEAAQRSVEWVETCRGSVGELSEETLTALVVAADACKRAGKEELLKPVVSKMRDVLEAPLSPAQATHPSVRAMLHVRVRLLLRHSGKAGEAEALLRQLVEVEQAVEASGTPERFGSGAIRRFIGLANAYGALGDLQLAIKQPSSAVDSFRRGLRAAEQAKAGPGEDGELVQLAAQRLGRALLRLCQVATTSQAPAPSSLAAVRLVPNPTTTSFKAQVLLGDAICIRVLNQAACCTPLSGCHGRLVLLVALLPQGLCTIRSLVPRPYIAVPQLTWARVDKGQSPEQTPQQSPRSCFRFGCTRPRPS